MSEIKINVDLDLETKKAKDQLDNFKKSVKDTKIPVELDISKVKQDAHGLKNILSDAFKIDSKTIGDLKQIGDALKQINKLIKNQNDLSKKGGNSRDTFVPFTVNKNTNIVKDVSNLVDDYKSATKQLNELDKVGKQMKEALDGFNKDQEEAYKKFVKDSKNYESYLKELEGDNLNSTLKKAINARKKSIELQEQLTKAGVVKVDNTQLRNEKHDGTIFTIENEKWKAMFAKTEAEAKDLEDLARKLKPKIDDANNTVSELITTMSNSERKLLDSISKAYENKPKFDSLSGYDNDNVSVLKMYLESLMPDVDKMGLDFDNFDDIFRGVNRFYSRLEQMQNEYNSKFANEDGFKALRMESLLDIEQEEAKRIINEAENNNNLLENVLKDRLNILNKADSEETFDLGIDEKSLKSMEEFIRLSSLINRDTRSSSGGRGSSVAKEVNEYLAVTRKINELQSQLYKSDINGTSSISKSLKEEIDLLRQKQLTSASAIRANRDLYESTKDMIKIEEQLSNARRNTKETIIDNDTLTKLDKTYKELDKIQDKLTSMQNTKGFLDNSLVEKTNSLLSETRSKLDANGIESDFKEIGNAVDKLNNNLKDLNTGNTLGKQEASFNISLQNMENKVNSFIDKCKEMGNAEHLIRDVENAFRSIDTSNIERANVDLKQMTSTLRDAEREAKQLSSTLDKSRGFFSNFGEEFRDNLFTFTAGELLADGIRNVVSSLGTLVMEYDTAMTNLKKVANPEDIMNISQLDAIEQKAVSIAKNVGQSSQDVIQAISDTIQMGGYGMEQATQIAEQTMMLANVAELTQEVASQGVVTMMSAFKLDPMKQIEVSMKGVTQSTDELTNAMDVLNYTGNNFAISSGGILDAITSGSNVLANYGVSLNDTVAMITAANTTLQDTSRVGNGLKTIQTKLAGIKASADSGELSLNKTAMALKEIAKIDVYSDKKKGDIKGMATIIEELGAKWSGFTKEQKAGLSEAIAGAQQASVFQSLMSNFDVMKQVQSELNDGWHFGSAIAENTAYVDSISGKLNTLKETWVGVFNTIFSSEATKTIIDRLIKISEAIANIVTILDDMNLLTPVLLSLGSVLASKSFKGISNVFGSGERSARSFTNALLGLSTGLGNVNSPITRLGSNVVGMGSKFATATSSVGGFLASASTMIPYVAGTALAVTSVAKAVDYFVESLDEEEKRLNSTVAARKEEISALESQKGKLSEIQKEYDELSKKPNKTSKEVEKLKELTKELAEIKPELVVGYDKDNNPILSMTGDVKGLISEIDRAIEGKDRLLTYEKEESAKNAIKQLHGDKSGYNNALGYDFSANDNELAKLETLTSNHVNNMSKLEKKRDKIINNLYEATGQERQKLLKDLDEANYEIEKAQDEYINSYQEQLKVIQEYSDKIGESLFSSIESSSIFKNAEEELKTSFSSLKEHLDFSDIKTEEQLLEAEYALNKLFTAAKNGDVDLDKLKSSIEKANKEFAKTGDSEKYAKNIDNIIGTLKEIPGLEHINFDMLKYMFEGIDTSVAKGTDALDEFLRAYNKTAADIEKGDAFAKALAEQKRHIEDAFNNLEITANPEVNYEIAWDLVGNKNLPSQFRDMVKTLLEHNHDETEILKFAQRVLLDLSDGEVDIEGLQKVLDEKFGKGAFEITPEILLNDNSRVAGVERVIQQINERFGEIPPTVKTIIEAEGITAFNEAKRLTEIYLSIPEEVRTKMTNNGLESASDVLFINQLLNNLPTSVVTNIVSNFPEVFEDADNIEDVINNLPTSILMEIKNNYPEVVEKSKLLQEAIDKIPATKESKVSVVEEVKKNPMSLLDRLFGKNKTEMTTTAIVNSQVNGLDSLKDFDSTWSSIIGRGNGASGASGASANGRSIDPYGIAVVDEIPNLARAKSSSGSSGGGSTTGFNATVNVVVNGMEALKELQNTMNNFTLKDIQATVSVNTAQSAKNMSGLIQRINQTKTALNTLSQKNVVVNTAQSAKNLSGLIVRVNQYKTAIDKVLTRTTTIHTAQSAKNVSGLIRRVSEYNDQKVKTTTFKTNADTMAAKVRSLTSAIKAVPNGKTITYNIKTNGSIPKVSSRARSIDGNIATVSDFNSQIQADTLSMQRSVDNGISVASEFTPISAANMSRATVKTPLALKGGDIDNSMKYSINLIKELEARLSAVNNQLSVLDKKMKHASNSDRIKYLKEQNKLYEENVALLKEEQDALIRQRNYYKYYLENKGFVFNSDGNMTNYEEKLIALEKEKERLDDIAKAKQDAYYNYHGDNDKHKDNLSKAFNDAKNKADAYGETVALIKKYTEEYFDVAFNGLPSVTEEFIDMNNAIKDNLDAIKQFEEELKELNHDSGLKNENRDISEIQNKLNRNEILLEKAVGREREKLLEERIQLQQQLKKETQDLINVENQYRNSLMSDLGGYGFKFRADGSIEGYGQKVAALKKSLSEDEFNEVFDKLESYMELTNSTIPDLQNELLELENSVKDYADEIDKLSRENKLQPHLNNIKEIETEYDKLSDSLDVLETKIKHAFGQEKLSLMKEQINLLEEQKNKQLELVNEYEKMATIYRNDLTDFGINFDSNGDITNLSEILNKYQDSSDIEKLKELIDDYLNVQIDKLPDAKKEWENLNAAIKEAYRDQLDVAKDMEDKITSMYKKQIEDRIEALNKETDAKVKALKKQKDAYNKYREEIEYNNESNEKLDEISELQRQLDIAMRDTSLKGQQRVKELQDMLLKAQKELDVITQNKIDNDINNMFDEESNRLEESNKEAIEKLEELWSDSKIAEMVSQALGSGVFIDIEGNVHKLEDALIKFADETGELFGVLGDVIREEWITNLQVAQDAVKDLSKILAELDVNKISNLSVMDYEELNPLSRSVSRQENNINFSAPIIHIEGNVDRDVMGDLKSFGEQLKDDIYNTIVNKMM